MQNFVDGRFGNKVAEFDAPTQLPRGEQQRQEWQSANRAWWESSPMRYDWRAGIDAEPGSREYFEEVDRRFFSSAEKFLPSTSIPFDALVPFAELANKDVLEIGVGQGTHAQLLSSRARSFTGIDLTSFAVGMTSRRFRLLGLPGNVLQMDAENMAFGDASFDYIWSWGVIHHSADTRRVLEEMRRVLRPGGTATVMVYHRSWWLFYVCAPLRRLFQTQFRQLRNLHQLTQASTDGAIARYYTPATWQTVIDGLFKLEAVKIYGLKNELVPLPAGRVKDTVENAIPDAAARLMTNRFGMGSFLVAQMRKI